MTRFAKNVGIAGNLPSLELKNLLNEIALDFFNSNLKTSNNDITFLELQEKYGIRLIIDTHANN